VKPLTNNKTQFTSKKQNTQKYLKKVLEELKTHSYVYFEGNRIVNLKQLSLYNGLYWDTYKYKVSLNDSINQNIYIKINKNKDVISQKHLKLEQYIIESYENMQYLHNALTQFPGYASIEPIACFPEWLTLITKESLGTDVWSIIRQKAKFYPVESNLQKLKWICWKCGKWLSIFQQITRRQDLEPFDFDPIIHYLDSLLVKLVYHQKSHFSNEFRTKIINFCQQLIECVPESDRMVAGIHGDFAPVNILVHKDEIVVLDLELPKYGIIYWDSSYFYYHLSTLLEIPIYRPVTIAKLQDSFIKGFGTPLHQTKEAVLLCTIHNIIQSLLYLTYHRQNVNWYRRLYDRICYKKCINKLRKLCKS